MIVTSRDLKKRFGKQKAMAILSQARLAQIKIDNKQDQDSRGHLRFYTQFKLDELITVIENRLKSSSGNQHNATWRIRLQELKGLSDDKR